MLSEIINEIKRDFIEDYFDLNEGLVFPVTITMDGNKKTLPYCFEAKSCDAEHAVTPDDSRKSVSYFEELSDTRLTETKEGSNFYESEVRFVMWINDGKMGTDNIAPVVARNTINTLNNSRPSHSVFKGIRVKVLNQERRDERVLSKWGYDHLPYLVGDFDFFSLRLRITWNSGCSTPVTVNVQC